MSDEATTPGTETPPVVETPAGGASDAQEPTVPEGYVAKEKYEKLLERLTPMEEGLRERDHLRNLLNERLEPHAPPAQPQDEIAQRMERFESGLMHTSRYGESEAERDAATALLGLFGFVRNLPGQFEERVALAPLPEDRRAQVQQLMKEAAQSGNRITPAFANQLLDMRQAQVELTKLRATPAPPPPNTRIVPSATPAPTTGTITYAQLSAEWANASPARKDELRALERDGKVVPG